MAGRVLTFVTLGLLLVAVAFAIVALNVAWATSDDDGQEVRYRARSMATEFLGTELNVPYGGQSYDDADGIGQVRAGGVLWLIGTIALGLAALLAEHRILVPQAWLGVLTVVVAGLAVALVIVAVILLPVGLSQVTDDAEVGDTADLSWVFGLYAAVVAAAAGLAATVVGAVGVFKEAGFKLEPASTGAADFDS